jgi:hypothetical protein
VKLRAFEVPYYIVHCPPHIGFPREFQTLLPRPVPSILPSVPPFLSRKLWSSQTRAASSVIPSSPTLGRSPNSSAPSSRSDLGFASECLFCVFLYSVLVQQAIHDVRCWHRTSDGRRHAQVLGLASASDDFSRIARNLVPYPDKPPFPCLPVERGLRRKFALPDRRACTR